MEGLIPLKKIKKNLPTDVNEKLVHGDFGNFIKGQKLDKKKEKKYKEPPYKDLAASVDLEGELTEKKLTKKQIKKRDEIADAISDKEMKDRYGDKNVKYAIATNLVKKEDYLPEVLDKKDVPHVKKLVQKLRDGSKTHAKQADELEVALKTEDTAIESELVIQDWNTDEIKFTEIETVDIIKAKPLKESHSDWKNDLVELDEKFQFLKHAFGKNIIIGTGASKVLGKNPLLSFKGAKNAATNKAMKALEKFRNMVSPSSFPKDASRTITKKTNNIITINPSEMGKTPRVIKKKNPPTTPTNLNSHYDWRADLGEDWQKVNRKDKTDGMSQKAVNAYKREYPGSKLKTAVTTKPSKLKKGSKASKRRKSFCARSDGQRKMHNIDCKKTPNKRICKARRRWNC